MDDDRHTIAALYAISQSVDRISSQQHRKGHVLPYVGDAVSEEDIHAKYEDGILKLSVPKKAPEKIEKDGYIAIEG